MILTLLLSGEGHLEQRGIVGGQVVDPEAGS